MYGDVAFYRVQTCVSIRNMYLSRKCTSMRGVYRHTHTYTDTHTHTHTQIGRPEPGSEKGDGNWSVRLSADNCRRDRRREGGKGNGGHSGRQAILHLITPTKQRTKYVGDEASGEPRTEGEVGGQTRGKTGGRGQPPRVPIQTPDTEGGSP